MKNDNDGNFIKIHLKRTWTDVESGDIMNVEYSTEKILVKNQLNANDEANDFIEKNVGVYVLDGIEYKTELIEKDVMQDKQVFLTKEQMFDFILNNTVTIIPDNTIWTDENGNKVKKKYTVSINSTSMSGFDLEDAINYYVNNRSSMK
ncbi:hypothetical protein CPT_Muenster_476 [Klebsiella phage Muenster]|nr:hypothetical protein CPT_Muenster_476 [Klebsiella phage Muenster]